MAFATSPASARVGRGVFDRRIQHLSRDATLRARRCIFFDHHFLRKITFQPISTPPVATRNHDAVGSWREFHRSCSGLPVSILEIALSCRRAFRCSRISTTSERLRMRDAATKVNAPVRNRRSGSCLSFQPAPAEHRKRLGRLTPLFSPRRRCSAPKHFIAFDGGHFHTDRNHRQP